MSVIIATIVGNKICITSDTQINDYRDSSNIQRISGYQKVHVLPSGRHAFGFVGSVPVGEKVLAMARRQLKEKMTVDDIIQKLKESQDFFLKSLMPDQISNGRKIVRYFVAGIDFFGANMRVFRDEEDLCLKGHGQTAFLLPPNCPSEEVQRKLQSMVTQCNGDIVKAQEKFIKEYVSVLDESIDDKPATVILS